jgi:prepilin-type N-terminal cleavage/methylation domain-containing protein
MDMKKHEVVFQSSVRRDGGFTLLELLVVIAVIAALAGLLFPAIQSTLERARKVQAKNDLVQIVTAVNAFYTEYGQYPLVGTVSTPDATYGNGGGNSSALLNELRGKTNSLNTRQIIFISPPEDATQTNPKGKIGTDGQFHDPWANVYAIRIDADYDGEVANPYNSNAGAGPANIRQGVIAWSIGKDTQIGNKNDKSFTNSDDVISWQ